MVRDSQVKDVAGLVGEVDEAVLDLLRVMPSLAPPINALPSLRGDDGARPVEGASLAEMRKRLQQARDEFFDWAEGALGRVAQYGSEKVPDGGQVFMYSMSSTVWRILRAAKDQGKSFEVVVTESRPGNEGLWTVTEMAKYDIPVSVSIDACIGELIPKCDVVFVGADVLSSTGHALCKAGPTRPRWYPGRPACRSTSPPTPSSSTRLRSTASRIAMKRSSARTSWILPFRTTRAS